ncbi:hypothetical protein RvY_10050-2 [Ramazzottius varieornatus]|uniref:Drosha n=1 Tax=Ramazzottius varieornatus TaxID=947166 RepID=A0A1D1VDW8_RAMVA|nr:hypothetical protein RvY_10050-2 [Ramazzottius varieornatus]
MDSGRNSARAYNGQDHHRQRDNNRGLRNAPEEMHRSRPSLSSSGAAVPFTSRPDAERVSRFRGDVKSIHFAPSNSNAPHPYRFLPAHEFYERKDSSVFATAKLITLHDVFRKRVIDVVSASAEESDDDNDSDEEDDETGHRKGQNSPSRKERDMSSALDNDIMFNERNQMNDGKACRCNKVLRAYGTKHGHLVGDDQQKFTCNRQSNNKERLFCYVMHLEPLTNFGAAVPTKISYEGLSFSFHGFCLLSHQKLSKYPSAQATRFNESYTMTLEEVPLPTNFVIEDLILFRKYFFSNILELKDWRVKAESLKKDASICDVFHFFPLFARSIDGHLDIAPMSAVLQHFLMEFKLLFSDEDVELLNCLENARFEEQVKKLRGYIAVFPGKHPGALRLDQIDKDSRDVKSKDPRDREFPALVHFATRSLNNTDQNLQRAQKNLDKWQNVMDLKPKGTVSAEDKMKLRKLEDTVQELQVKGNVRRDVTVVLTSRGVYNSGMRSDIAQWGLLVPWVAFHFRFHISLDILEKKLEYSFNDRSLLELALTHPSYRTNFGVNPDHVRNSQANLGWRKASYRQSNVIPKSGMKTLIYTMAQLGADEEMASTIMNYERLEFLGDAVLEFLTSLRLFLMFPDFQEGSLATFRATLVQNNHLAVLAETYSLSHFLLIGHGRELKARKRITDKQAAANCFEAICGAIYLDGGIKYVDELICRVFSARLFQGDEHLSNIWKYPPAHVSTRMYPDGDRHLIEKHDLLQRVVGFEQITGIQFRHIRLLANAFSSRQVHENPITIGNNQRLEFFGDTVLQLIVSDYLFKHFPTHHEGHLSLLRSSLVNNETQALVCGQLGMMNYYIHEKTLNIKDGDIPLVKQKDKADLVEAYLGALYLDKGLTICEGFCRVFFFPKLTDFIGNQTWSDPKSRLQQSCLTLKSADGISPGLPEYRVIDKTGPSNNRIYEVAVYFNGERLATGAGPNTKQAEKVAAEAALKNPMFLSEYERQQSFARRAVTAQKYARRDTSNVPSDHASQRIAAPSGSEASTSSFQLPRNGQPPAANQLPRPHPPPRRQSRWSGAGSSSLTKLNDNNKRPHW